MHILNLIGLVLGYLGSISLSVGIIKSKQEVVDEETPFWGPNPFKMRSTLRSRLLGFTGVAMLVAGFATSTVAMAFNNVFYIDNVPLAVVVIVFLIGFAYTTIIVALRAKKRAHIDAKSRYYFNELIKEVRELKGKYEKEPLESTEGHTLEELKKQHTQDFSQYMIDLNAYGKKALGKLISGLDKAEKFTDITATFSDFLAEHDTRSSSHS